LIEKKRLRKRRPRHNPNRSSNQIRPFSSFSNRGNNIPRSRGALSKVLEKYTNLAQDAFSNGDRIVAENYFQYAEHYQRVLNETSDYKKLENPEDKSSTKKDDSEAKPSRTERAISGKNERNNKLDNNNQNLKKSNDIVDSESSKSKSFTSDGIEALKPFEI